MDSYLRAMDGTQARIKKIMKSDQDVRMISAEVCLRATNDPNCAHVSGSWPHE